MVFGFFWEVPSGSPIWRDLCSPLPGGPPGLGGWGDPSPGGVLNRSLMQTALPTLIPCFSPSAMRRNYATASTAPGEHPRGSCDVRISRSIPKHQREASHSSGADLSLSSTYFCHFGMLRLLVAYTVLSYPTDAPHPPSEWCASDGESSNRRFFGAVNTDESLSFGCLLLNPDSHVSVHMSMSMSFWTAGRGRSVMVENK